MAFKTRTVKQIFENIEMAEGVGARVRRSIGTRDLRNFDPFLMLDHFKVAAGAGFADHGHRGMQTVTYMTKGAFQHADFAGNEGTIETGDIQIMTAGKGMVHAEMPVAQPDGSANEGLQLWVDLPNDQKLVEPSYEDLKDKDIPHAKPSDLVDIKIISGESFGIQSNVMKYTPVWIFDIKLQKGGVVDQKLPEDWNSFIYVMDGEPAIGDKLVSKFHTVTLTPSGDGVHLENSVAEDARVILYSGKPLNQSVIQHGPFVAKDKQGIYQAFMDYQGRTNGFERAADWQSEIAKHLI